MKMINNSLRGGSRSTRRVPRIYSNARRRRRNSRGIKSLTIFVVVSSFVSSLGIYPTNLETRSQQEQPELRIHPDFGDFSLPSFNIFRDNPHETFIREVYLREGCDVGSQTPEEQKRLKEQPMAVHRIIQYHKYARKCHGNWKVKGIAIQSYATSGIGIKSLGKLHEDLFVLYQDDHKKWYRVRYAFGFWHVKRLRFKSNIYGSIQQSAYVGDDDVKAANSFPKYKKEKVKFYPQHAKRAEDIRDFSARLIGLTAAIFHQIMWPTTHQPAPENRTFLKYKLINGRMFGKDSVKGNCRHFAEHVAWMLGIRKQAIRNMGSSSIFKRSNTVPPPDLTVDSDLPDVVLNRFCISKFKYGSQKFKLGSIPQNITEEMKSDANDVYDWFEKQS